MRTQAHSVILVAAAVPAFAWVVLDTAGAVKPPPSRPPIGSGDLVVLAYNDLGMHCMNDDFSEMLILPPFNTLRAQVLKRGEEPDLITHGSDVDVSFVIPANTHSADKTNFWTYAEAYFGVAVPPDVGLFGTGLSGDMPVNDQGLFEAVGIPLTPVEDSGRFNPYQLATVRVDAEWGSTAVTQAVVPVSNDMTCNLCHESEDESTAMAILRSHDGLHDTDLANQTPVICAACHEDVALGAPGLPDLPSLSGAMHTSHAPYMDSSPLENKCYSCHPGLRTQCQRDIHAERGVDCIACHDGMLEVGSPDRQPWVDLPRCGGCHERPGFEFEQPGTLFKDSVGHGGVHCGACHSSPHAITPTTTESDNQQALLWQGHTGVIDTCIVCHTQQPDDSFFHKVDD